MEIFCRCLYVSRFSAILKTERAVDGSKINRYLYCARAAHEEALFPRFLYWKVIAGIVRLSLRIEARYIPRIHILKGFHLWAMEIRRVLIDRTQAARIISG